LTSGVKRDLLLLLTQREAVYRDPYNRSLV